MKRLNLIPLALTTLMLGACSSEDGLNVGSGSSVAQGEKGYISFSLNLPTTSGVANRAANDNFDNGDAEEYGVTDAELLLFKGTTESDAKLVGAYSLTVPSKGANPDGSNITTTRNIVREITNPNITIGEKIYALVIVNGEASNIVTIPTDESNISGWSVNGVSLSTTNNSETTYAALATSKMGNIVSSITTDDKFLMLNAPLYTVAGGMQAPQGGEVKTLTEINPNNIFPTQAEAKANPAANVYVERAVAKVTVTNSKTSSTTGSSNVASYQIKGWTLDITNKSSYLVRNTTKIDAESDWWSLHSLLVTTTNPYRFVGAAAVSSDGLYRTYWGKDPNYSSSDYTSETPIGERADNFNNNIGNTYNESTWKKVDEDDYCLENTFTLSNMNDDETTRVIVAAALTTNNEPSATPTDFYVVDNDKDNIITSKTDVENVVKNTYLTNSKVLEILNENLQQSQSFDENDFNVTFDDGEGEKKENGGYLSVTGITIDADVKEKLKNDLNEEEKATVINSLQSTDIVEALNAAHKIAFYKGGVSYYPIKIKHFGDDLTKWETGKYETNYNQYLGRYGVLRNNWYTIDVTGIKSIGAPEVPEVFGSQDDPEESWISVSINVLSWAKRSQSVEL